MSIVAESDGLLIGVGLGSFFVQTYTSIPAVDDHVFQLVFCFILSMLVAAEESDGLLNITVLAEVPLCSLHLIPARTIPCAVRIRHANSHVAAEVPFANIH